MAAESGARSSEIILILGGARSGKSRLAERIALARGGDRVLFIATAEALDDEMSDRIAKHRATRPSNWYTLEAPRHLIESVAQLGMMPRLVVLDCLTLWVTNELLAKDSNLERRLLCELDLLMEWARIQDLDLIMVSNEVGQGIVPADALSRRFQDVLGRVNAHAAQVADKVYWMVAGIPIDAKSLAASLGD